MVTQVPSNDRYDEFDRLVCRYAKMIRWFCWMYSGGDETQTADMVQEVLLALWCRRYSLRMEAPEVQKRAWVRLQCLSVLQHQRRRRRVETVSLEAAELVGRTDGTLQDCENDDTEEQRERLYELAKGLTRHERMLLDLMLENYSVAEIAVIMGIKARSVSQLKQRMLAKMKANSEQTTDN